jgi:uncharacterized coiled-coil protein SlyX
MALPKQVQAQLAEVEELEKSLAAQKEPKADTKKKVDAVGTEDTEADGPDPNTEEVTEPAETTSADTSPTDVADPGLEQKYKTLQGKYNAEVPRLHQQVKMLTEQLNELKAQKAEKVEEPTKPKERVSYVTEADEAEFGKELIDVQRRVAREVSQEYEERLEAQTKVIEELRSQVANTGTRVGEMSFAQRLQQLVPDFVQIDNDERWIAWLNEVDPILRGPRRIQAKAAFEAGDVEAVAHYVNLFKQSIAQPEDPAKDARRAELQKQVAPNRSANSARAQSAGREAKIYSAREVADAWNKIRVLNSRGSLDEAAKLEADLTAAYLEGRVRN